MREEQFVPYEIAITSLALQSMDITCPNMNPIRQGKD